MFEVQTSIPVAKDLYVRVMDYDLISADDLIGETVIDLENRFLTRHRATVGLPQSYCASGLCRWRDSVPPTQILAEFCRKHLDTEPVYRDHNTVTLPSATYTLADFGKAAITAVQFDFSSTALRPSDDVHYQSIERSVSGRFAAQRSRLFL